MDASQLAEVRDRLHAQGIRLGEPLQAASTPKTESNPASPVQIVARDEDGNEHRLIADSVKEWSLSSGTTLYYLHIPEAIGDCHWLVGRTLELSELEGSLHA